PICITTSESLAEEIKQAVNEQLEALDRYEIAKVSIENQGVIIVVDQLIEAFELVNNIAPEHLQLMFKNETEAMSEIRHDGEIFICIFLVYLFYVNYIVH